MVSAARALCLPANSPDISGQVLLAHLVIRVVTVALEHGIGPLTFFKHRCRQALERSAEQAGVIVLEDVLVVGVGPYSSAIRRRNRAAAVT